jgi:hypothetical protein
MNKLYKIAIVFLGLITVFISPITAQEDWKSLASLDSLNTNGNTNATFKTSRLINAQSIETVKAHTLDFRVSHRFGNESMGIHSLYGLDAASDIRLALEYGITNRLTVGFSRSRLAENLEGLIKYRLLMQKENGSMPLSVTLFANSAATSAADYTVTSTYPGDYSTFAHRMSYTYQILFARKFSRGFSFQIMPSMVHRNFITNPNDKNDLISMGAGGRLKFTKRSAIVVDYFYNVNPSNSTRSVGAGITYYNPLGIGWEIETGGHVFTIMFSNAAGIIENEFLPNTTDSWSKRGFKFSFDISRNFKI